MAEETPHALSLAITSYDTALCVIPPNMLCGNIDQLRELYDKAYELWPPHINLIYPFVAPESLPRVRKQIQAHLKEQLDPSEPRMVSIHGASLFRNRKIDTIFLRESQDSTTSYLVSLRSMALQALGQKPSACNLHLTIGQPEDRTLSSRDFLLAKAELLPRLDFQIGALAILIRERIAGPESPCRMRLWGTIEVAESMDTWRPTIPEYWIRQSASNISAVPLEEDDNGHGNVEITASVREGSTYCHDSHGDEWAVCSSVDQNEEDATMVTVASYNVLVDSDYPPARDRDTLLVRTILSDSAMADILVLQEVSDDFLSYMLNDAEIQRRYPYTSHAPPSQADVGPLPSLRNLVVLSRWGFSWKYLPFHRRHKGAILATFGLKNETSGEHNLVVAGIHLTAGLTDSSVATKRAELQRVTHYLEQNHNTEFWIVAGDFNITTSTYTIDTALKDKSITNQTKTTLASMEAAISDAGFLDAWSAARVEAADETGADDGEELFEGEDGATFDPRNNVLAAGITGTSHSRSQRYDRILVLPRNSIRIDHFNHFGQPENVDDAHAVASDHNGIRASLEVMKRPEPGSSHDMLLDLPVEHKRAVQNLSSTSSLTSVLEKHYMFPTEDEVQRRQQAFSVLKDAVLGVTSDAARAQSDIPLVLVPVGSYALGVWTSTSDIDCLCIGTISSKTFFKLVRQRLIKAENRGIRILRRVEANSGTLLELSVDDIDFDLQYCPAARVVERWPDFKDLPASDAVFNLSILSLRKLKPYRDLLYIQRTLPSRHTFRLAYSCIKLWATQHGIYSSKFGYLGGVHISLMLSWVHKRIAHDSGTVSAGDLVTSFFNYYSNFDWANELVYDAFFHKKKPRYYRSAREPMAILGFHAPNSNIAHTSTVPGLQILVKELKIAATRSSDPSMTWADFFRGSEISVRTSTVSKGEIEFLGSHENYLKIDIQFWGRTLAKGKGLVGWIESRALSLVVEIHKALPALGIRVWPARFTDSESSNIGEYHGCYLIGLSKHSDASFGSKDERQAAKQSLDKVADRFLERVKTDEKNYDSNICWVGISLVKSSDLNGYRLDDREWGDYTVELDSDSEDEEDLDEDLDRTDAPRAPRAIPQRPKPTAEPVSTSKLRPASDVLNRLRWDPHLDPADYIVGYEDRFLGARETGLEKWKTEQTDEEFIPQHRILYFKKRSGDDSKGELVWERATRLDMVFGSGAGAGATMVSG